MAEQQYFYYVAVNDIHANGDIMPPISQSPVAFISTAGRGQRKFLELGYNLPSIEGLFYDDGRKFVSEVFPTDEKGMIPGHLSVLFDTNPYTGFFGQFPLESMRFDKLMVFRMIQPTAGGRSRRRSHTRRYRK